MPVFPESTIYDILGLLPSGEEIWLRPHILACSWEEQANELAMRLTFQTQATEPTPIGYLHELLPMGTRIWLYANYGDGFQEINRFVLTDWAYLDEGTPMFEATCYDDLWYLTDSEWEHLYTGEWRAVDILWDIFNQHQIPIGPLSGPIAVLTSFPARGKISDIIGQVLAKAVLAGDEEYFLSMRGGLVHVMQFGTNDTNYVVDSQINSLGMSDRQSIRQLVTEVRVVGNANDVYSSNPALAAELGIDPDQASRLPIEQTLNGHREFGRLIRLINSASGDTPASLLEEARAILMEDGEPSRIQQIVSPDFPIRKGDLFHARHGTMDGRYAATSAVHDADAGIVTLTVDSGGTLDRLKKQVTAPKKEMLAAPPEYAAEITSGP